MKCEKCGLEKNDALRRDGRDIPKSEGMEVNPVLCAECCSKYPGREWMRGSAS